MNEPAAAPAPKRRISGRLIGTVIAGLLIVAGVALLVLPYDTTLDFALGGTTILRSDEPIKAQCEAPILDAFHGESDGWLNYAPDSGVTVADNDALTGSWCSPQSVQRAGVGALLIVTGMSVLLLMAIARKQRNRSDDEPEPDPDVVA